MIKNIGVFCGARQEVDEEFKNLAVDCGKLIAKYGCTLVYGGGNSGLMGKVSHATHDNGGTVIGVYPRILNEKEPLNPDIDYTYLVDTMFKRKEDLITKSDAFIILPGGIGTLDEVFEVLTLKILGENDKPIIFLNHKNYWRPVLDLLTHIVDHKFASPMIFDKFHFADTLPDVFAKLGYK